MGRRLWYTYSRRNTRGKKTYTGAFKERDQDRTNWRRVTLYNIDGTPCTNKQDADDAARRIMDAEHCTIALVLSHPLHAEILQAAEDAKQSPDQYLLGLHAARMSSRAGELLADYLSGFWADGSAYLKAKVAAKAPLSAVYVRNSQSAVKKHIAPWLRKKYPSLTLQGTGPAHLEALKQYLVDRKLGPARVNGIMKAARVALGEAWRMEAIATNPASKVHKLPDPAPKRRIFSMEEARRFFEIEQDDRYKAANLTAALAGLRQGEILGLQSEDIRENVERYLDKRGRECERVAYYLHVCHNFQATEPEGRKLKGPKHSTLINVRSREVPIPERLAAALRAVAERNPYGDGFVLWGDVAGSPPSNQIIEQHYKRVCAAMGIEEEERRARGLTFHAWRHFFNSNMRPYLPDYQLRMLTGHTSEAMTDRYTTITDEQRAAAGRVAGRLLE